MITRIRELLDDLPSSARRAVLISVVLVAAIIATLVYRVATNPATDTTEDGADTRTFPTTSISRTTTPSVALPPGMDDRPTTESTTTKSDKTREPATATPEAEAAIGSLAGEKDITKWVPTFAILWNSFYMKNDAHGSWQSNINPYCTTEAKRLLARKAPTIWTGAIMNKSTVRPTSEPVARKLWGDSDASMWRVSTTVSIASIDPRYAAADGIAKTTWDFYVVRQSNGTYRLDSWADPSRKNENPNAYTPER